MWRSLLTQTIFVKKKKTKQNNMRIFSLTCTRIRIPNYSYNNLRKHVWNLRVNFFASFLLQKSIFITWTVLIQRSFFSSTFMQLFFFFKFPFLVLEWSYKNILLCSTHMFTYNKPNVACFDFYLLSF